MAAQPVLPTRFRRARRRTIVVAGATLLFAATLPLAASAQGDPREGLAPGYFPWSEASSNIDLLDNDPRVPPFDFPPTGFMGVAFANSDLAFTGDHAIVGSFNGFQVYDISDQDNPVLSSSFVCPGGQGDPSVFGDLLFISVEETRGRIDCGVPPPGPPLPVDPNRFRGVRIFDISDIDNPVQLPGVQTCRGSHTHTLVTDPDDPDNIYVYNSGTAGVRSPLELATCENAALTKDPVTTGNPTQWRIDVIKVPLDRRKTPRSSAGRGSSPTRTPAPSTACRTRCPCSKVRPRRPISYTRLAHPKRRYRTRRCPTPTPATTSVRSRRSACSLVPARATASWWTSPTR